MSVLFRRCGIGPNNDAVLGRGLVPHGEECGGCPGDECAWPTEGIEDPV